MGRLTGIIGVVLVVALGILASASIFTVHQTQQAWFCNLVTRAVSSPSRG